MIKFNRYYVTDGTTKARVFYSLDNRGVLPKPRILKDRILEIEALLEAYRQGWISHHNPTHIEQLRQERQQLLQRLLDGGDA